MGLIMTTVSLYGCGAASGGADNGVSNTPQADYAPKDIVQSDTVSNAVAVAYTHLRVLQTMSPCGKRHTASQCESRVI